MHLISIRNLRKDAAQYPDVKNQIDSWNATVKQAKWQNLYGGSQDLPGCRSSRKLDSI